MQIKGIFKKVYPDGLSEEEAIEQGIKPELEFSHVEGTFPKVQKFWDRVITRGVSEGWLSVSKGKFVIKSEPNDIVYKIITKPGYYCCFDNCLMESGAQAKAHIEANYKDQESPDPSNPAGYRKDDFYTCELVED